ncbi:MAG TPA: glycosyltransferase family 1 protein [Acidimicrobiales bacterium]|jgi:glycosyltransferase involved in cell wall biosynthesis|nr:glycosyltransferase family 1 protein [Acidimicrobiales bacterium]
MRSSGATRPPGLDVAFDATPLLGAKAGVGAFCTGALPALAEVENLCVRAFAVSWRRRGRIVEHLPPGVAVVDRPMPARPVHRAWRLTSLPPIEWFTGGVDVVHGTNFIVPPSRRAARVVTVHDLTTVRFPEMCDDYTQTFPPLVRRAIQEGAWVHTPSAFVREEVIELLGAAPERVRAVHHGVPPVDSCDASLAEGAGSGPVPDGPYVLALGTIEPRKDVATLVQAFDQVAGRRRDLYLVVAGRAGWGMERFEGAVAASPWRDRVLRLGYVSDTHRARLLRGATLFAFPSVYEGFGFPPLEAMVAGVPVVTTTAGALPEVVGDGAELVEPGDADALAAVIDRLLVDDGARADLVARGRQRIRAFSWKECAAGLAALYRAASASAS